MSVGSSLHLRVTCALLSSAARLVPVPLVDDWLRDRIARFMIARTIASHGRSYPVTWVAPLYEGEGGCVQGCLAALFWLPIKLLLLPIRKLVAYATAAHGLSKDLTLMLLLGRTLDRCLAAGMLRASSHGELAHEARIIRMAYDNAATGFDTRVLNSAIGSAVASVKGLPRAAARALRRAFRRRGGTDDAAPIDLPEEERRVVEQGVERIEQTLERPDVAAALARFDRTFDENLAVLQQR